MDQSGISKLDLKRRNRMQILKLLRQKGPTSRIDISEALELTRAAVTIITNEMIEQGVIYEKGEQSPTGQKAARGRKKILLDISSNYKFAFGAAVDAGQILVGLSNLKGQVLDKSVRALKPQDGAEETIQTICDMIRQIISDNYLDPMDILGAGVCLPEGEYPRMGISTSDYVPDFSSVKKRMEEILQLPVVFTETVRALALAELDFNSPGKKPRNLVFIRYGDEIDAAVILQNRIYTGTHNCAARFGHLVVNPDGEACACGRRGCVVTEISYPALLKKVRRVYSKEATPALYEATGGNPENLGVLAQNSALQFADRPVAEIFKEAGDSFALAVSHMITLFDPERVVLYGTICQNKAFLEYCLNRLAKLFHHHLDVLVQESFLQKKTAYLGGCAIAIREFFIERGGLIREELPKRSKDSEEKIDPFVSQGSDTQSDGR